ncbi:glycerate kinase [Subtercola sp. Z020]|uniref:glycerate kinase n=1 Tax=Subtercola sp. Z020 TaxID=2080582 RepID=UPI000CE7B6F6|nr:glycerate kinase [Subtercola sp. Z020]PPF77515.1 glycerate kinase [Subtercola sp. Z020]
MKVVIAPDSFKGSLAAPRIAHIIAEEWRRTRPADQTVIVPMADGGEGTLEACATAMPEAVRHHLTVIGPDDRPVESSWLQLADPGDGSGATGIIEFAESSGITLLEQPLPFSAHSYGFGQVIRAAVTAGCRHLVLGLGGSGSSDGGHGALTALGARFEDRRGLPVGLGNSALRSIERVDVSAMHRPPRGGRVTVLSDVTNPLLGAAGAVRTFGEQKGITAATAAAAESNLKHYARQVQAALTADPDRPGAGAAGGVGFGLVAWGATITSGARAVGELLDLPAQIERADIVITGEGRYDSQSERGKVADHVRRLADRFDKPALLIAGQITVESTPFALRRSLADLAGSPEAALRSPERWLRQAVSELAQASASLPG